MTDDDPLPEPRPPLLERLTCEHADDEEAEYWEPMFRDGELVAVRVSCLKCEEVKP